ncbi:MAG: Putative RND superfamily exporter, partial [Thermotogales bacterium 46_20]
ASLVTAIIIPMTEFGIFATIGIFVAFLLVIFFLGAIFNVFAPKKVPENFSHHSEDLITRFLNFLGNSIVRKKGLIISIIIVVVIVSGFYVTQVKPDSSIEARLGLNNPITKSMDYFKDKFGGVDFLYVYTEAENVKHPYILRSIDKIQNYARRLPSLSQPTSISIFLTQLNEAMENKKIIPANPAKIDNLWFFAEGNEFVDSMIKDDDQSTVLQVRSKEMTSLVVEQSIQEVEQFIQQIPKTVKEIDMSQLSPEEREQYYPYIAEDIISSWQANGIDFNQTPIEELKEELIHIASMADTEFVRPGEDFIEEVISLSSLELEDFGITAAEIEPAIVNYLQSNLDGSLFIEDVTDQMNISEYDAEYLQNIIDSSIAIATEREKIQYAQEQIANISDLQLTQDDANYLWYLTDDYVYVPADEGEVSFSYRLTGIPVITNEVNKSIYDGQVKSMLTAFLVVFILLIVQFRSLLTGIVGIVPILLTIITAFGIMGIANISLNIGTMMVASIAIGAGIDYTIHFINRYKHEFTKNTEPVKAITMTLTGTGRAILFNSISVAAGCFVLAFSEIKMISEFAILIGSVMLISVVYTLLFLPILLHFIKFKEEKDVKQK